MVPRVFLCVSSLSHSALHLGAHPCRCVWRRSLRVHGRILFLRRKHIIICLFYCRPTFALSLAFRCAHFRACILRHTCVPSLGCVSRITDSWVQWIFHSKRGRQTVFQSGGTGLCPHRRRGGIPVALCPWQRSAPDCAIFTSLMGAKWYVSAYLHL